MILDSDSGLQELPQDNVTEEEYFGGLYEPGANIPTPSIKFDKAIENNVITVRIEPAQFKEDLSTTFRVYNARGKVAATVTIKQQGDKNYWVKHDPVRLGEQGESAVLYIMSVREMPYLGNLICKIIIFIRKTLKKQFLSTLMMIKLKKHGEITIVQSTGGSRLEMLMQTN